MALTQISTAGVKDDAVTSGKIPANAVGSSELADNAVDTAAIAEDAVTTAKIAAGNITATELATNSVEGGKITDSAITNAKIHPSAAIAGSKIDPSFTSNITVSGTDPRIIFTDTNNNPDFTLHANGGEMQVENSGSGTQVKLESSGSTRVFGNLTVDTNTLHVDSSNNLVSIGTTSGNSNFKLDVNGAARIGNTTDGIIIENSTSNPSVSNACRIHRNGATGELNITSGTTTARNMIFNTKTSGAESMRLTSTGDFCVGTTTATGKAEIATSASEVGLTVTNDTHDSYLQILATAANKNSAIFFGDNGDGNIGAIDYDHNTNELAFKVNGTEKARIDNTGDIGIGSSTINLQGTDRTTVSVNGTNSAALCLNRSDTITGFLYADSGEFRIQAEAGGGNNVRIRNNNGTIARFDDDGLKFNDDTATANGLDDYEEGSWTPTISAGSGSLSVHKATYTKIGRTVFLQFYFSINGTGSNGNNAIFTGLPFTVQSNGWTAAQLNTGYSSPGIHCRCAQSSTQIDIKTTADSAITFANLNGTWILSGIQYHTDH